MKKEYAIIAFTYLTMQLISGIGVQITEALLKLIGYNNEQLFIAIPLWLVFSFLVTLLITLYNLRHEFHLQIRDASPFGESVLWAIGGIFLAFTAQSFAIFIEKLIGIEMGSQNTSDLISVAEKAPVFILVISIFGPILEEIVFRKILFGTLYKRFNFFISALISSVIFSIAHMEFEHILLYAAIGFTFAFLYVRTKRIIVPIITHVSMNTIVILYQGNFFEGISGFINRLF